VLVPQKGVGVQVPPPTPRAAPRPAWPSSFDPQTIPPFAAAVHVTANAKAGVG
jgi:hypothetical protein